LVVEGVDRRAAHGPQLPPVVHGARQTHRRHRLPSVHDHLSAIVVNAIAFFIVLPLFSILLSVALWWWWLASGEEYFLKDGAHLSARIDNVLEVRGHVVVPVFGSSLDGSRKLGASHLLVVGAGSSGVQIADELERAGKKVYLSVGPHDRPPRAYRNRDYCWWLGVFGEWDAEAPKAGKEHVTIAVSGTRGGHTVDFRSLAQQGITLVGMTKSFDDGVATFHRDLADNVAQGDENYLSLLAAADAYVARNGLDLPEEPEARNFFPDPECLTHPLLELDLAEAGVTTILWATGYTVDFSWLKVDAFDVNGKPKHQRGVSSEPGLYFLGLPWLSRRGSSFIWGVWHDAKHIADHIATQRKYLAYRDASQIQTETEREKSCRDVAPDSQARKTGKQGEIA